MTLPVLLMLAASQLAPETGCPATHSGVRLSGGQVNDGPIEEMVILKEDEEHKVGRVTVATWDVRYVYKQGRRIHLVCEYGTERSITVRVRGPAKQCTYTERGTRQTLGCR